MHDEGYGKGVVCQKFLVNVLYFIVIPKYPYLYVRIKRPLLVCCLLSYQLDLLFKFVVLPAQYQETG